jgi:signal transduction histidine kinase
MSEEEMHQIEEDELLDELKRRFEENKITLGELRQLTRELETVNQKLKQSEALKGHFLSNIRNEINNPLTAILGAAELLTHSPDAASAYSMAEIIRREAFNLDFQLRTIFTAAELEAGEIRIHPGDIDIERTVLRVLETFQTLSDLKTIRLRFENETDPECVSKLFRTDSEKLQLILSNLVSNAIEYSPNDSEVSIRTKVESGSQRIFVSDQGIGIASEDRQRIFDRFVQLDTGMTKRHPGNGLGLSVAWSLLELMNGRISVSSEIGKGSTFSVDIEEIPVPETVDATVPDGDRLLF